jgi:glycosyltransferase involved in cell wall biosynthesis
MSTSRLGSIVFAHDHLFYQAADGAWFARGGQYSAASWSRYLAHAEQLIVAARHAPLAPIEDRTQLSPSGCAGVSFVPVPSLAGVGKRFSQGRAARDTLLAALQKADLLIARLPSQTGLLAIALAQRLGKPWAVECVGCAWDAHVNHASLRAKLYAPIARQQMRVAIAQAPVVSYVTERFLQQRYATSGVSIACSDVEIELAAPAEVLDARRSRIQSLGDGRPVRFGLMGSFAHQHKGIDIALQALHAAQRQLPSFELHVLGPGDPSAMMRLASRLGLGDGFKPCAPLPKGPAVQSWFDEVDVYLQPSRYEALPRALIEAMARACPALASDTGGIDELLPAAQLHAPGDHQRLAAQLIEASDPNWQLQQASDSVATALRFDTRVLAEKRARFWFAVQDLVQGAPQPKVAAAAVP